MKAGWKNRIQERIYFEQKKQEKHDTLMEIRNLEMKQKFREILESQHDRSAKLY